MFMIRVISSIHATSQRAGISTAGACILATFALAPQGLAEPASAQAGRLSGAPQTSAAPPTRNWSNLRRARLAGPYPVQVLQIIDGDTFVARVPIWIGQDVTTHVRLRGIDAPELKGRCPAESRLAAEAQQVLTDILASGPVVLRDIGTDKYAGRVIARVFVTSRLDNTTEEAGRMLVASGYARPYRGGRRNQWCEPRTASSR